MHESCPHKSYVMRPHATGHLVAGHPVPARTERRNLPKVWMQRDAQSPL